MTATQFINQYVTGRYALYRKIDGCLVSGDVHDGPAYIPEDADYLEVVEVRTPIYVHVPHIAIVCRRINE